MCGCQSQPGLDRDKLLAKMNKMTTYLIDDDDEYKILLLYILKNLNTDIKREIYDKLVIYEIIEITTQGWTELTIQSIQDELYYDMYDLYDDLDIGD